MKILFQIGPFTSFKFFGGRLRIQVYYPELQIWTRDLCLRGDTVVRVRWSPDYMCAGFAVLGFGIGIAYDPHIAEPLMFDPNA